MTAPELKPCPFCGGEAITSPSVVDRQVLYAHCKDHTCPGWTVSRCPPVRWNRRADLTAVQPAQVRVKPLVWEDDGYGNFRAQSIRGGEGVDRLTEPRVIGDDLVNYEAWGIRDAFDSPEAAQAAVEVEIASEIMAAIEPQSDPRDEVIKGLVDALRNCDGGLGALGVPRDAKTRSTARAALAAAKAVMK